MSPDLNTPKDITDDTSLTSIHILDQEINSVDNNGEVNESQPIDIKFNKP